MALRLRHDDHRLERRHPLVVPQLFFPIVFLGPLPRHFHDDLGIDGRVPVVAIGLQGPADDRRVRVRGQPGRHADAKRSELWTRQSEPASCLLSAVATAVPRAACSGVPPAIT